MPARSAFRFKVRHSRGLSRCHSCLEQIVRVSRISNKLNNTLKLQPEQLRIFDSEEVSS